jgi:RNA polymerase sigma-70 factor (ECF subfamily)
MTAEPRTDVEQSIRESWARADWPEATRRIVEGYGPQVLGYLVRTMRNEADACEVYGRFCEHLWRGLPAFEGRSAFKTWAYRLATHARTRFWEDPYRRRGTRLDTGAVSQIAEQVRSRTLRYLRTEVKDGIARLREKLEPDEQGLLTLRIDRGMAWAEIAEVLAGADEELPEKELKTRASALRQKFQRVKDKIRRMAQEEGLLDVD